MQALSLYLISCTLLRTQLFQPKYHSINNKSFLPSLHLLHLQRMLFNICNVEPWPSSDTADTFISTSSFHDVRNSPPHTHLKLYKAANFYSSHQCQSLASCTDNAFLVNKIPHWNLYWHKTLPYCMVQSPILQALAVNFVNLGYNTDTSTWRASVYKQLLQPTNINGAASLPVSTWPHPLIQHICSHQPSFLFESSVPLITALTR
jgi:hypothetical protein